jgi:hypothetical protein
MQRIIIIIITALLVSACRKEVVDVSEEIIQITVTTELCIGSYPDEGSGGPDRIGVELRRDGKNYACLYTDGDNNDIEGFNYTEGYEYELLVLKTRSHHINTYKLIEVLSMKPADLIDDSYHPYAYLEWTYSNPPVYDWGLILVYNGDTLTNRKVEFVSSGYVKPKAILTFENVISGEAKTVLTADLTEAINPDNGRRRLSFEGVHETAFHFIKYSGFIEGTQLLLELNEE